jgi:hypothetical protein
MAIPTKPSYSHGSTGTAPASARDYENGDPMDADEFDYYINTSIETIKDLIDALNTLDSDGDGTVDEADYALDSDKVDGQDWQDIKDWVENSAVISRDQLDGSGGTAGQYLQTDGTTVTWVDLNIPVRSSDPSSPSDGDIWVRDDL